jgi:hypothetical protein
VAGEDRNDYDDGHLLVAAVRVLAHREGRPPTVEETADLIRLSREVAHHLVRRLAALGAVRLIETPFEARLVIADHTRLEALPRGEASPAIASELETFLARNEEKQKELDRLFDGGAVEKKKRERIGSLEEQFKKFRDSRRAWKVPDDKDRPAEERAEEE